MIISEIRDRTIFFDKFLPNNPGYIIVKFTADWCGPCKNIKNVVYDKFEDAPEEVVCCDINVDNNSDIFAFFKSKKMVVGIPAIMVWKKGNTHFAPDDFISGGDPIAVHQFLSKYIP